MSPDPAPTPPGAPAPPPDLGEAGCAFWTDVVEQYALRVDERRVLHDAAAEVDLIGALSTALASAPLTVRGSQGQEVASPLVTEVRQHRSLLASLLRQLALPDPAGGDDRRATTRSEAGRMAARARWDRRSGA